MLIENTAWDFEVQDNDVDEAGDRFGSRRKYFCFILNTMVGFGSQRLSGILWLLILFGPPTVSRNGSISI